MRIERISIDGFGTFFGQEMGPFNEGLNIVLGENEAGKSTLLDFVRGILYGFADGKNPKRQHLPLRGGKHGGRLTILDSACERWTIERHAKEFSLSSSGGESGSARTLADLLGHTDDRVYQSIFAFGLAELEDVKRLTDDAVRDTIFSAGIVGGGRSASIAMRQIEEERSELTRVGRGADRQGPLQRLFTERTELERQLRVARNESVSYEGLVHKISRQQEVIEAHDARLRTYQERAAELRDLQQASTLLAQRNQLTAQLHAIPAASEIERTIGREQPTIDALLHRLDGYQNLRDELDEKLEQSTRRAQRIDDLVSRCGLTKEQCLLARTDITLTTEIAQLRERHTDLSRQLDLQEQLRMSAHVELEQLEEQLEDHCAGDHAAPPQSDVAHLESLSTLRAMLGTLEQMNYEIALGEERDRYAKGQRVRSPSAFLMLFIVITLLGLGAIVSNLARRGHLLSTLDGFGLVVLLLGVAGAIAQQVSARSTSSDGQEESDRHQRRRDLTTRIAELATAHSLSVSPTEAEIGARERVLRDRERHATERTKLRDELRRSCAKITKIDEAIATIRAGLTRNAQRASELGRELGHERPLTPEMLAVIVDAIDELKALVREQDQAEVATGSYREQITQYEREASALFARCGSATPGSDAFAHALGGLRDRSVVIARTISHTEALLEQISRVESQIETLFSRNIDGERLRRELELLSTDECENQLLALEVEIAAVKEQFGLSIRQRGELEGELNRLQDSDTIMALETELGSINAAIAASLRRWSILSGATLLLKRTLNRYEAERQPAVISRAAELFAEVTAGRYVTLIPREDASGRRTLEVVRADGSHIDSTFLSAGTAQQLYLCVRLAYAEDFAERATSLPLVLDDVLVNFDPVRSLEVARAFVNVAKAHQVLLFTCHPNIAEIFQRVAPGAHVIELPGRVL